jgi:putative ABC transport system permease protein
MEVAYVLMAELLVITLMAIPIGAGIGYLLAEAMIANMASDIFRIPFVMSKETIAAGVWLILDSLAFSSILIMRQFKIWNWSQH